MLIFHGDADTVVPLQQSETLRDAVTLVGGEVSLHVMAGEGHGFRDPRNQEVEYEMTEQFLRRFLP
jgi:dipeptidyl aminopeptidase/acylaminoacyl peptidase